tara:strand:+ start:276 stop:533 length:258 start_codon:yes stop_codon:yes gene_type:complete
LSDFLVYFSAVDGCEPITRIISILEEYIMIDIKAKHKKGGGIIFLPKRKKNKRQILMCEYLNGETKKGENHPSLLDYMKKKRLSD